MNTKPQRMHAVVENVLKNNKKARNSDIELYKAVLKKFYGTTDISQIDIKADIFCSLKRCRQKIQANNPFLQADENVKRSRNNYEKQYKKYARYF